MRDSRVDLAVMPFFCLPKSKVCSLPAKLVYQTTLIDCGYGSYRAGSVSSPSAMAKGRAGCRTVAGAAGRVVEGSFACWLTSGLDFPQATKKPTARITQYRRMLMTGSSPDCSLNENQILESRTVTHDRLPRVHPDCSGHHAMD